MTHQKVNVGKLVERLVKAANGKSPSELARSSGIDPSRITRFLNGDFKKLTPILKSLCENLDVQWVDLLDPPASDICSELVASLSRIVGQDPNRIRATRGLLRSLEVLADNRTSNKKAIVSIGKAHNSA